MILTKQYLNEQVQKRNIFEDYSFRDVFSEYDIFISYSWNDVKFASLVMQLLENCGYKVYIDFEDNSLSRSNVTKQTALNLIDKMRKCKCLLYLHSPSASVSKWCPWELGCFSGMKNFRCAYIPLLNSADEYFKNQEYLKIYPYVDYETIANKDTYAFWVCENENNYVNLKQWINGKTPYAH